MTPMVACQINGTETLVSKIWVVALGLRIPISKLVCLTLTNGSEIGRFVACRNVLPLYAPHLFRREDEPGAPSLYFVMHQKAS